MLANSLLSLMNYGLVSFILSRILYLIDDLPTQGRDTNADPQQAQGDHDERRHRRSHQQVHQTTTGTGKASARDLVGAKFCAIFG